MTPRPRRDLRGVGDRYHLDAFGEPGEPHADGIGDGAARAGVDLVEHQCGRRTAVGQHHLERQQEARQLPAGGDLHQRPRPRARVGLHPELHAIDAVGTRRGGVGRDLGEKPRAVEPQRLELGIDGAFER